jgi:hypothetical protein
VGLILYLTAKPKHKLVMDVEPVAGTTFNWTALGAPEYVRLHPPQYNQSFHYDLSTDDHEFTDAIEEKVWI